MEGRLEENKKKRVKLVPRNLILGNIGNVNSQYDKKITIFKGQIIRTYLMNVDRNMFMKFQENVKLLNECERPENQEHLYLEKKKSKVKSHSPIRTEKRDSKLKAVHTSFCQKENLVTNHKSENSSFNGPKSKARSSKFCVLPNLNLVQNFHPDRVASGHINRANESEKAEVLKLDLSNIQTNRAKVFSAFASKIKSKSVKKIKAKSFFDSSDFYYN